MEKTFVVIEAKRECYSLEQVKRTMTVAELIAELEQYDDDALIAFSHDNGYTYGGLSQMDFRDDIVDSEDEY